MPDTAARPPSLSPELLTANQVAELLGVSPRTVCRLDEEGALPAVHIRSCTRWRRADVLRYIERLAGEPPQGEVSRG
jgi:excisionase family DNA binding protein